MSRFRQLGTGGSRGNQQLTAIVAILLVPLLAAEGATLLDPSALLTVHAFLGLLLIPVLGLKVASAGWRMLRYYRGSEEYVLRGPPHIVLRALVAPMLVASSILLFSTGVALLALHRTAGLVVGLHKASFIVWVGALGLHVLARIGAALGAVRKRVPGLWLRLGLASVSLVAGVMVATMTLPAVDRLQDNVSGHVGLDST